MIHLKDVRLQRGTKVLLENVNLLIYADEKVGFVGHNGAGKTSLFLMLQNELSPDQGEYFLPKHLRLQCLKQEMPASSDSALAYACAGDTHYHEVMQALQVAESTQDGMQIAQLHDILLQIDGYRVPSEASKILLGLGFRQSDLNRPVNDFSGGFRMRLNLAQLLLSRADLLLLDEPTNHLDLEAILWLENWLRECNQTLFLISHDREFLDRVCNRIVHLDNQSLTKYTGNYSDFEKLLAQHLANQQASYEKQQAVKAHLTQFIDRFRAKASKAKQAQSRMKQLERMEWVAPVHASNPFHFDFKPAPKTGDPMLVLRDLVIGYDGKAVVEHINLSIRRQDRIALVGPNGAGKSTFVKCLAGEITALSGEWIKDPKVKIGYFAQHQLEYLNLDETPLWHLESVAERISTTEARAFLGRFNFSEEQGFRPIHSFSGGEKARLALALIVWQQPNLLLLDEPTNHLDLDMREALNLALQAYEGAMILISHDRHLLQSVSEQIWLVSDGHVKPFTQDLAAYQAWLLSYREAQMQMIAYSTKKITPSSEKIQEKKRMSKSRLKQWEKKLLEAEEDLKALDATLLALSQAQVYDAQRAENLGKKRLKLLEIIKQMEDQILGE